MRLQSWLKNEALPEVAYLAKRSWWEFKACFTAYNSSDTVSGQLARVILPFAVAGGVLGAQMGDTVKQPIAFQADTIITEQSKVSDQAFDKLFNELGAKRTQVILSTASEKLDEALDERSAEEEDAFHRFALSNASERAFAKVIGIAKANNILTTASI